MESYVFRLVELPVSSDLQITDISPIDRITPV